MNKLDVALLLLSPLAWMLIAGCGSSSHGSEYAKVLTAIESPSGDGFAEAFHGPWIVGPRRRIRFAPISGVSSTLWDWQALVHEALSDGYRYLGHDGEYLYLGRNP